MKIGSPTADTPTPCARWRELPDKDRLAWVSENLAEWGWAELVLAVSAAENGYVTVALREQFDAAERGRLLRAVERQFKASIDSGLTVWLEPAQDRNRPRQLRGVKVL